MPRGLAECAVQLDRESVHGVRWQSESTKRLLLLLLLVIFCRCAGAGAGAVLVLLVLLLLLLLLLVLLLWRRKQTTDRQGHCSAAG